MLGAPAAGAGPAIAAAGVLDLAWVARDAQLKPRWFNGRGDNAGPIPAVAAPGRVGDGRRFQWHDGVGTAHNKRGS
jgi:hypothetical protein